MYSVNAGIDVERVTHEDAVDDLQRIGKDGERVVLARAVKAYLKRRVIVSGVTRNRQSVGWSSSKRNRQNNNGKQSLRPVHRADNCRNASPGHLQPRARYFNFAACVN